MENIYVEYTAPGKWRVTAHRSDHGAFRLVLSTPEGHPIAFNETSGTELPKTVWNTSRSWISSRRKPSERANSASQKSG